MDLGDRKNTSPEHKAPSFVHSKQQNKKSVNDSLTTKEKTQENANKARGKK
jgi:hypothetical protein